MDSVHLRMNGRSPLWAALFGSREHLLHALDLDRLVRLHVRRELVDVVVLHARRRSRKVVHHLDGAFVMANHEGEEEAIPLGAARFVELRQLARD